MILAIMLSFFWVSVNEFYNIKIKKQKFEQRNKSRLDLNVLVLSYERIEDCFWGNKFDVLFCADLYENL